MSLFIRYTRAEAFDLIRSLVDEIVLVPIDGELKIELKGDLAGILELCSESKSPSRLSPERLEQFKLMVWTAPSIGVYAP